MIRAIAFCALSVVAFATRTPTWPSETYDVLEGVLYEQLGAYSKSFTPEVKDCKDNPDFPGQNIAAEWIRAGFHDIATADVAAGTGGLDSSIALSWIALRIPVLLNSLTRWPSPASGACSDGKVDFPYRAGRIDATGPGPSGVPEPQDDIDSTVAAFKRAGFTKTEMIGLVACGHSLGGVNGIDFPTIVPVPENETSKFHFQNFDSSDRVFDNKVAKEFLANNSQNPLAFGLNITMRSDARVFNSDGKKEITRLAASDNDFYETCSHLLERMVNTVPKAVRLSSPIAPIPVKPISLFATVNFDGTMTFKGTIRLIDMKEPNPGRSVKLFFRNRKGHQCQKTASSGNSACHVANAVEDPDSATYSAYSQPSGYYPEFKRYNFTMTVPILEGISGFDVQVTDKLHSGSKTVFHDNNGQGYPFDDAIIPQFELSCQEGSPSGFLNVTIAVRDDTKITQLSGSVEVATTADPDVPANRKTYVPRLTRKPFSFEKLRSIPDSGYTLYNGKHTWNSDFYKKHYDVEGLGGRGNFKSEFNFADVLPECQSKK